MYTAREHAGFHADSVDCSHISRIRFSQDPQMKKWTQVPRFFFSISTFCPRSAKEELINNLKPII